MSSLKYWGFSQNLRGPLRSSAHSHTKTQNWSYPFSNTVRISGLTSPCTYTRSSPDAWKWLWLRHYTPITITWSLDSSSGHHSLQWSPSQTWVIDCSPIGIHLCMQQQKHATRSSGSRPALTITPSASLPSQHVWHVCNVHWCHNTYSKKDDSLLREAFQHHLTFEAIHYTRETFPQSPMHLWSQTPSIPVLLSWEIHFLPQRPPKWTRQEHSRMLATLLNKRWTVKPGVED